MKTLASIAYARLHKLVPDVTFYIGSSSPVSVEESGQPFVALKDGQKFERAGQFWSVEDRVLFVNIYAPESEPGANDAEDVALQLFSQIDPHLNGITQSDWPDVVVSTRRDVETIQVPDSASVLVSARYEIRTW